MRKYILIILALLLIQKIFAQSNNGSKKPNILFCIADDASFQYMSAYGFGYTKWINTPGFDQVAKEGILFTRAYTPNAKCAPSRASILTGRNSWQLEEAGNHNAIYPEKFVTVIETLGQNGYFTGFTGKGWGPGQPGIVDGKPRLLTGAAYSNVKLKPATNGISPVDYAANFDDFLKKKPSDQPFFFWYGSHEPHREYELGSGITKGHKKIADVTAVPPFWPENDNIKSDLLDYAFEVEHFDSHILKMLQILEKAGELENTIIVVTSDNGMPFPRIKGHMYDFDNHLPLAIMWKNHIIPGQKMDDFVSFIDFAPTFLALTGIKASNTKMQPIQGRSLMPLLLAKVHKPDPQRDHVLLGREREDVGRPHDEGYPVRAIVKGNFFYAINYEPDRWPSGNPETGYMDTDGSPTKTEILAGNRVGKYHDLWMLCFGKKGSEELYETNKDPYSMNNLAADPAFSNIKAKLKAQMEKELKEQKDPRMFGNGAVFDNYPYGEPRVINFYERFFKGEKIPTNWIQPTDFEKNGFNPAQP